MKARKQGKFSYKKVKASRLSISFGFAISSISHFNLTIGSTVSEVGIWPFTENPGISPVHIEMRDIDISLMSLDPHSANSYLNLFQLQIAIEGLLEN